MNLLREYIRELVVEQVTSMSQEQEQAAATIYYVQSYAYIMSELFRRALFPGDLPIPHIKNEFGEEAFDNLDEGVFLIYEWLVSADRRGLFQQRPRGSEKPSFSREALGEIRDRYEKMGAQDARDAFSGDPMNALLELIDVASNENVETGMSIEEAMLVMDVGRETEPGQAAQKLAQLIKTDNNVIGLLDALAMM